MKGIELPISTLIVIVIAMTILLAVIAIFFGVYNPSKEGIEIETAKNNACQMLVSLGCNVHPVSIPVNNFDADKDKTFDPQIGTKANCNDPSDADTHDSLWSICVCYYGLEQTDDGADKCKTQICNCPE
jgi:hypothetical protein